jgi:hypothetical protein
MTATDSPTLPVHDMAALTQLVHNYNHTQMMACVGVRMDPYAPCNGSFGNLCMQCPRKKGLQLTPKQLS